MLGLNTKTKLKVIVEQIGAFILMLLIIGGVYYYSWITGGSLTSVKGCTSSFIDFEMNASEVKIDCPNLTNQDLVNAVTDSSVRLTDDQKDALLLDITEAYK